MSNIIRQALTLLGILLWDGDFMDVQKIQFAAGLKILILQDTFGRETEVCVGHRDITVTHKAADSSAESMRRYNRQELETLLSLFD